MIAFLRSQMEAKAAVGCKEALCFLAISGFFTLYLFWDIRVTDTLVFLFPFLYAISALRGRWMEKLFWVLITAVVMLTMTNLCIVFFSLAGSGKWNSLLLAKTPGRILFVGSVNLLITLMLFCFVKVRRGKGPISQDGLRILLAQNAFCMLLLEAFFYFQQRDPFLGGVYLVASLFGVLFSISSLVEYEVLSSYAERERLRAQEVQFLKLSAQHQGELEGLYAQILEMQHDFKHQIQVVESMLEQGECAESRQYLEQFRAHQPRAAALTGNLAVDALLTAKRSILQEKGIAFSFQAYPLQGCPLDDVELCTVLGNLLDNAMEGVGRLRPEQKKEVHLEFQQALNLFFIVCENAANPDALKMQGDRFLSSKEGDGIHGVGISSMRRIVERAGGALDLCMEGNAFSARIQLPIRAPQDRRENREKETARIVP